ncbi:MAG TPA: hypothetical protein VF792_07580 [Ktedonobacterales bacterium]
MSGFERSSDPERHDAPGVGGRPWPDDFTAEEAQFASELRALFPIEDEVLPPLYIQTLLDEEMQAPLDKNDVRRLTHAVKRNLGLPQRPLFTRQWAPSAWADQISAEDIAEKIKHASRPIIALTALLVFAMFSSMYLATPSFAQGLRLLFGNTGAQQVATYPSNIAPEKRVSAANQVSTPMPTYWIGPSSGSYIYQGMRELPQEQWTSGSILDIQYVLSERSKQQSGSGVLDIREFRIANTLSAVLQSVQDGSASYTSVNGLPAVYVDGMWVAGAGQRAASTWQSGTRSMLIFERDGVIFWMVGDQRDGLDEAQMVQFASQLAPTTMKALMQNDMLSVRLIGAQLSAGLRDPIGYNTELLTVISRTSSPDNAAGEFVSAPQPPQQSAH